MWSMWGQTLNYELYFSPLKINEINSAGKSLKNDLSPPGFHFLPWYKTIGITRTNGCFCETFEQLHLTKMTLNKIKGLKC